MRDDDLVLKIQQSSVKVEAKQIQQETRHEAGSKKTLTGRGGRYNAGQARSSWFSSGVCNAQNSGLQDSNSRRRNPDVGHSSRAGRYGRRNGGIHGSPHGGTTRTDVGELRWVRNTSYEVRMAEPRG